MTNDAGVSSSLDGSRNARQPRKTRFPRSIISSSTPRWHHGTSPSSAWEAAVRFLRFQVLAVLYKASSMSPCPRTLLGQVSTSPTFLGDHIASLFTISRAFFWSYLHLDIIWVTLTQRILLSFRLDRNNLETQWERGLTLLSSVMVTGNGDIFAVVMSQEAISYLTHEPGDELMSTWSKIATTLIMFCSILWPKYLQQQKYLVLVMEWWRSVITIRFLYFTQNPGPHFQCQCSMTKLDFWMIILIT